MRAVQKKTDRYPFRLRARVCMRFGTLAFLASFTDVVTFISCADRSDALVVFEEGSARRPSLRCLVGLMSFTESVGVFGPPSSPTSPASTCGPATLGNDYSAA